MASTWSKIHQFAYLLQSAMSNFETEVFPFSLSDEESSFDVALVVETPQSWDKENKTDVPNLSHTQSPPPQRKRKNNFFGGDNDATGSGIESPGKIASMIVEDVFEVAEKEASHDIEFDSLPSYRYEGKCFEPISESTLHLSRDERNDEHDELDSKHISRKSKEGKESSEKSLKPSSSPVKTVSIPASLSRLTDTYANGFTRRKGGFTNCILHRCCSGFANRKVKFVLYLQHYLNTKNAVGPAIPILAAEKQLACKTPNFHIFDISNDTEKRYLQPLTKKNAQYVGKLRSTFDGAESTLYGSELYRQQYAAVVFDKKRKKLSRKNAKPRSCRVFLPVLNEDGRVARSLCSSASLAEVLKTKIHDDQLLCDPQEESTQLILGNKLPQFSRGAYRLHFGGRTREASVKNFQLSRMKDVHKTWEGTDIPKDVVLQMGKRGKDQYHVDFACPMTVFQAFGLCLAQFVA